MRVCSLCHRVLDPAAGRCPHDRHEPAEVESEPVPEALGPRFAIEGAFAASATSTVYRAAAVETGRRGLLKILPRALSPGEIEGQRILREWEKQAALASRALARPVEFGDAGGRLWLFREHADGMPLSERLARYGSLPVPEALAIGAELAAALVELHRGGLLHRDLKPAHVILRPPSAGRPKCILIDTGIPCRGRPGDRRFVGHPAYISPEQVAGKLVSFRSDLYALGLLLHEMLGGEAAFASDDTAELFRQHLEVEPPPLEDDLPGEIPKLVQSLLAKDPRKRPFSAQEVQRVLEPYMLEETTQSRPVDKASTESAPKEAAQAAPAARRASGPPKPPPPPEVGAQRPSRISRRPPPPPSDIDVPGVILRPMPTPEVGIAPEPTRAGLAPAALEGAEVVEEIDAEVELEEVAELQREPTRFGVLALPETAPATVDPATADPATAEAPTLDQPPAQGVSPTAPQDAAAAEPRREVETRGAGAEAPAAGAEAPAASAEAPAAKLSADETQELQAHELGTAELEVPATGDLPPPELEPDELPTLNASEDVSDVIAEVDASADATGEEVPVEVEAELVEESGAHKAPSAPTTEAVAAPHADAETTGRHTPVMPRRPSLPTEGRTSEAPTRRAGARGSRTTAIAFLGGMAAMGVLFWALGPRDRAPELGTSVGAATPAADPLARLAPAAEPVKPTPVAAAAEPTEPAEAAPSAEPVALEPVAARAQREPVVEAAPPEDRVARPAEPSEPRARAEERTAASERAPRSARAERAVTPGGSRPSSGSNTASAFDEVRASAREFFSAGRYREAAVAYERATAMQATHAGSFAGLGAARAAMGDLPGAISAYERAVALEPGHSGRLAALGRVYLQAGRRPQAIEAYRRALELDPSNTAARNALSHLAP